MAADSETMSFIRRSRSSAPFLTESSESAPSYIEGGDEKKCRGGKGGGLVEGVEAYLAEGIEYVVEIFQDLPLSDLGNIVHRLASVVADTSILVGKASQHRGDYSLKISGQLLYRQHLVRRRKRRRVGR